MNPACRQTTATAEGGRFTGFQPDAYALYACGRASAPLFAHFCYSRNKELKKGTNQRALQQFGERGSPEVPVLKEFRRPNFLREYAHTRANLIIRR